MVDPMRRWSAPVWWVLLMVVQLGGLGPREVWAEALLPEFHVVKAGDTCMGIVRTLYKGQLSLRDLHDLNPELGSKPPHHLKPGMKLRLRETLGPVASLTFVRPDVKSKRADAPGWGPAKQGQLLFRKEGVATEDRATAKVAFSDSSLIQLKQNSLLIIYGQSSGTSRLSRKRASGVSLEHGSLLGSLAALRKGAPPMKVKTPGATVQTVGAQVRVEVDSDKTSLLSVFDGNAAIKSQGVRVRVKKGQGTVARYKKPPERPRPLPKTPEWKGSSRLTHMVLRGSNASPVLTWIPVEGAAKYHVEVASDPAFDDCMVQSTLEGKMDQLRIEGAQPGRYYARVASVDGAGLQSPPSAAGEVIVIALEGKRLRMGRDGSLVAPFRTTLRVAEGSEPVLATLDGQPVDPQRIEIDGPGTRHLSFRATIEGFAPHTMAVTIEDVAVDGSLSPPTLSRRTGRVGVRVEIRDGEGHLVPLEGVWARAGEGPATSLVAEGDILQGSLEVRFPKGLDMLPIQVYLPGEQLPRLSLPLHRE